MLIDVIQINWLYHFLLVIQSICYLHNLFEIADLLLQLLNALLVLPRCFVSLLLNLAQECYLKLVYTLTCLQSGFIGKLNVQLLVHSVNILQKLLQLGWLGLSLIFLNEVLLKNVQVQIGLLNGFELGRCWLCLWRKNWSCHNSRCVGSSINRILLNFHCKIWRQLTVIGQRLFRKRVFFLLLPDLLKSQKLLRSFGKLLLILSYFSPKLDYVLNLSIWLQTWICFAPQQINRVRLQTGISLYIFVGRDRFCFSSCF